MEKGIYALMFFTGLTGGFGHCIGMCGPMVATYSLRIGRSSLIPHFLYNTGRIFTYTFLGALVGFSGSFLWIVSGIETFQKTVMAIAGLMIVIMGLAMAGVFKNLINRIENNLISGVVQRLLGLINRSISEGTLFPLGIVMGFIPCGLVYTSLMIVVRVSMDISSHTTAMLRGAMLMGIFGIGTMPSLMVFGHAVGFLRGKMRARIYRLSSFTIIVMGVYFLYKAVR